MVQSVPERTRYTTRRAPVQQLRHTDDGDATGRDAQHALRDARSADTVAKCSRTAGTTARSAMYGMKRTTSDS
jgi:hypothetical protein